MKTKKIYQHSFIDKTNYKLIIKNYYYIYNKINKLDFTSRSMDILLFDWLYRSSKMISKVLDFYQLKKKKILKYDIKKKNYYFLNSYDFFNSDLDKIYNFLLYRIEVNQSKKFDRVQYYKLSTKKFSSIKQLKKYAQTFFKFFYQRKKIKTLIYKPCVGVFSEIYLNIKINKVPIIYYIKPLDIKSNVDFNLRNKLKNEIPKNLSKKQILMLQILVDITPISYLENLNKNLEYINKSFPSSVNKVFCTDGLYTDDLFKTFLAFNYKKFKIYVAQHGMHNSLKKNYFEEKISDYFLSYSKIKKHQKTIPLGIINKPELKKKIKNSKSKKILHIFPPLNDGFFFDENSISKLKNYLNKIDNKFYKNTLRFHSTTQKDDISYFRNNFKNIDIMDYNKNIYKSLNEHSFACFHH